MYLILSDLFEANPDKSMSYLVFSMQVLGTWFNIVNCTAIYMQILIKMQSAAIFFFIMPWLDWEKKHKK